MYRIYDVNIFKSGDFPKWNNLCIIKYKFRDDSLNHIGVDSGGSSGTRAPIIKMGAKPLFCTPSIIRREFKKNYFLM